MKIAGISIIVIGLLLTAFTAFTFFTKKKVADFGGVEITKDQPHRIKWSPLIGLAVTCIGGAVLWQSTKK